MAGISIIKKIKTSTQIKFDWQASEGAPKNYPIQILYGSLIFPDVGSLYVPDGVNLHNGWGVGRSSHIVGEDLKSLPNKLSISFFSYTEDQFYTGEFDLPYKDILSLFQSGHYSPKDEAHITYDGIIVGVAPGGAVAVWVVSLDRTIEIFFGYADKEEGDWKSINDNPKYPRKEYIRLNIEESLKPDALEKLHKSGIPFGLWERYHRLRYAWNPVFTNLTLKNNRISYIQYYNGERDFIDVPVKKINSEDTRAVPSELIFVWMRPNTKPLRVKLFFNEDEIFNAFEKLGSQNKVLTFEMRIMDGDHFSVVLHNDTESVELKQTNIKTYGIPE